MPEIGSTIRCSASQRCKNNVKLTALLVKRWGPEPPCAGCRSVCHYWEVKIKENPQAAIERQRTLRKWQDRMVYFAQQTVRPQLRKAFKRVNREITANGQAG